MEFPTEITTRQFILVSTEGAGMPAMLYSELRVLHGFD